MKVNKEELKELLLRKRGETRKALLGKEEPKSRKSPSKKGENKKAKLDYEVFLQ